MTTVELIPAGGPDHLDPDAASPGRGVLVCDQGWLPLRALSVTAEVAGADAAVTVRQQFANPTTDVIEAVYIHPLPDRAAVVAFAVTIGDRRIEGQLKERGEARAEYDQALASGHRAAITEEDRPDVFTTRVGNLAPGDVAEVELTLVQPLPEEDGQLSFRFPLVVAPRYIPGSALGDGLAAGEGTAVDTDAVPDASRITPPVLLPGVPNPVRLDLRAVFAGGVPAGLASSLHALATGADGVFALRPGERLNRDVILRWPAPAGVDGGAGDPVTVRATLDVTPDGPDGAAPGLAGDGTFSFRLTAPPVTDAEPAAPRDVVVLLDRSGSMGGWKMAAARRAAARIVDSLGPADRFTVLAFDHTIERPKHLPETLIEATDRNRWLAVEWLAGVEAEGGTELWPALAEAFRLLAVPPVLETPDGSDPGELPPVLWYRPPAEAALDARRATCLLVTDGQVGNEDQVLGEVGRTLGRARVFTVGIDQAVNAGFLRRLAAAGGGRCELVESEDRLDEAMGAIHRRIADAPLRSVTVQADAGTEILQLAPAGPVDCFTGVPLVLRGRYRGAAPVLRWSATGADGAPCGGVVAAASPAPDAGPVAGRRGATRPLWARARIRDLEDHLARHRFRAAGLPPGQTDEIVALSLATGVLSRFTAFVAVDLSETVDSTSPRPVVQPVESPAGWAAAMPPVGAMSLHAGAPPMAGAPGAGPLPVRASGPPPAMPASAMPAPPMPAPPMTGPGAPPAPAAGGEKPGIRRLADRLRRNVAGGGVPPAPAPVPATPGVTLPTPYPSQPAAPGPDLRRYAARLEELVARIEAGQRGPRLVADLDELVDDLASIDAPSVVVEAVRSLRDAVNTGAGSLADAIAAARGALAGGGAAVGGGPASASPPVAPRPDFWR